MTLIRSTPDGLSIIGWRGVITTAVFAWLLPSVLGGAVVGLLMLTGTEGMGDAEMTVWAVGTLALVSPLLSWLGFVLVVPVVAALLRRGRFGWLPALVLGAAGGAVLGLAIDLTLAVPFGMFAALVMRAVLGRLYPAAFAA